MYKNKQQPTNILIFFNNFFIICFNFSVQRALIIKQLF